MQIARVVGTVVSSQKNQKLAGAKLLLVQPETPLGDPRGPTLLAIDSAGAGVGERVLVVSRARRPDRRCDGRRRPWMPPSLGLSTPSRSRSSRH